MAWRWAVAGGSWVLLLTGNDQWSPASVEATLLLLSSFLPGKNNQWSVSMHGLWGPWHRKGQAIHYCCVSKLQAPSEAVRPAKMGSTARNRGELSISSRFSFQSLLFSPRVDARPRPWVSGLGQRERCCVPCVVSARIASTLTSKVFL